VASRRIHAGGGSGKCNAHPPKVYHLDLLALYEEAISRRTGYSRRRLINIATATATAFS